MIRRTLLFVFLISVFINIFCLENDSKIPKFSVQEYQTHLKFLSSDLLEGRATGTRGMELAELYVATQFEKMGLKPIDQKKGYFQKIPFHGFNTLEKTLNVKFSNVHSTITLDSSEDICMVSELPGKNQITADGDLLFVGYGIKSPEYKWDDFKGIDIKDKIIVVIVNDPEYEKTGFGSESMTYYGRWAYKIEYAKRNKAKGILLIHHPKEATYGWNVIETGWIGERVAFQKDDNHKLTFHGWISHIALNTILTGSGLDYQKLKERASSPSFKPFSLKTRIKVSFTQKYRKLESSNIIGIIPGTDPFLKEEVVIYTGHLDHLGTGKPDQEGDTIYNGALDNASGISAILCLAQAFVKLPPPKRTLVFMPVTAEELGLYGSTWYVNHPIFPLKQTAVVINKDCMNHYGKRAAFSAFPAEFSSAFEEVKKIGEKLGLKIRKRSKDIGGGAFRSDHFPYASRGVTALSIYLGGENLSMTKEEEDQIRKKISRTYHRPNDEIHPLWQYEGVIQELDLLFALGKHWADGAKKPQLNMSANNPYLVTMRWYNIKIEE